MSCRSSRLAVLTAAAFVLCASIRARETDVFLERDIGVVLTDGVRLALDLYLPASGNDPLPGKHPVLLARTPYDKKGMEREARWFAARGYAVVVNDVRGRYASQGVWRMIVDDPADGAEIAGWIVSRP